MGYPFTVSFGEYMAPKLPGIAWDPEDRGLSPKTS